MGYQAIESLVSVSNSLHTHGDQIQSYLVIRNFGTFYSDWLWPYCARVSTLFSKFIVLGIYKFAFFQQYKFLHVYNCLEMKFHDNSHPHHIYSFHCLLHHCIPNYQSKNRDHNLKFKKKLRPKAIELGASHKLRLHLGCVGGQKNM